MNRVDLFPGEKDGLLFQWEPSTLLSRAAKQAGMNYARLAMGLCELFIGGVAHIEGFAMWLGAFLRDLPILALARVI